jgi:hypothetical protein
MGIPINGLVFTRTELAERWMRVVVDLYCDVQPDIEEWHLPFGQKRDVYQLYLRCMYIFIQDNVHTMEHLLQEGITYLPCLKNALFLLCFIRDWEISQQPQPVNNEDPAAALTVQNFGQYAKGKPLSPSKFYKMWRERLSNVKVVEMFSVFFFVFVGTGIVVYFHALWSNLQVRTYHRFAICSICCKFNDDINKAATVALKNYWKEAKLLHLNDVSVSGFTTRMSS